MGMSISKSKFANLPITNHFATNPLVIIDPVHVSPAGGPLMLEITNTVRDATTGRVVYEVDHDFGLITWRTAIRNPHTGEWLCVAKAKWSMLNGLDCSAFTGPNLANKQYDVKVMDMVAGNGGGATPVTKLAVKTASGYDLLVKTTYYERDNVVAEVIAAHPELGGLVIARARMAVGLVTPRAEIAPGVDVCGVALLLHVANQIVIREFEARSRRGYYGR